MKKILFISIAAFTAFILSNCSSSKKTTKMEMAQSTYENNVSMVIMNNCAPCHIPAKGGNKKPLDNFASVKENIDDMIRRIELNPGERGFMPFKRGKLSDSTIAVFKQWKEDGMLEK